MGNEAVRNRREEYAEVTRAALVIAGRDAFARDGFRAVAVDAIARAARVTRGAFYHHFADKTALFEEVVTVLQADATATVEAAGRTEDALWDRTVRGIGAYLEVCADPTYRRIVLQDAPAVLGERRAREIEEAYPLALLAASLRTLARRGEIEVGDVALLTGLVDAMICRLALLAPDAADPAGTSAAGRAAIVRFLETYRSRGAPEAAT